MSNILTRLRSVTFGTSPKRVDTLVRVKSLFDLGQKLAEDWECRLVYDGKVEAEVVDGDDIKGFIVLVKDGQQITEPATDRSHYFIDQFGWSIMARKTSEVVL